MMKTTMLRRRAGGTQAAAGMVPSAGRGRAMNEGAATLKRGGGEREERGAEAARTDYMVDDHDPLDARQALAAADLMMSQMPKKQEAKPLKDGEAIQRLRLKLDGRISRPKRGAIPARLKAYGTIIRRDPRDVAFRYLRRMCGGDWYRGGAHVARYCGGNGIGFHAWQNDNKRPIRVTMIEGKEGAVRPVLDSKAIRQVRGVITKSGGTVLPGRRVKGSPKWCVGQLAAGRIELRIEGAGDLTSWRDHQRGGDERFLVTDFYSGDFIAWWTLSHKEAFDSLMDMAADAAKGKEAA